MIKISGVVITFNEEKKIGKCLESMMGVVDEIVVLDSFSTDATPEICKKYNVRFEQQQFKGYGVQKRDAVALASYDYILSLDADEVLTEELRTEINELRKLESPAAAYCLNRHNYYAQHFVKHCGWFPDYHLRLFDRRVVNWSGNLVHETVEVPQGIECVKLKGGFNHYTYDNYAQHKASAMKFAGFAAKQRQEKGKKPNVLVASFKALFRFVKTFIFQLGFLDGYYGLLISWVSAKYAFRKYNW